MSWGFPRAPRRPLAQLCRTTGRRPTHFRWAVPLYKNKKPRLVAGLFYWGKLLTSCFMQAVAGTVFTDKRQQVSKLRAMLNTCKG